MGKPAIRQCVDCGERRPHAGHGRCRRCYHKWRYETDPVYRAKCIERAARWNRDNAERHAAHERERRERAGETYRESERARHQSPKRVKWRREYQKQNRERAAKQQRLYRQRNPKKVQARWEQWYADNPEKRRAVQQTAKTRRRAREQALPSTLTTAQWQAILTAYDHRCAYCGESGSLTQDHVIPITCGGGTTADNIVPACGSCNSRKGNRPPPTLPAIRLLL